jgi:hypothetical protein
MAEQELEQLLQDMKRFGDAYDELDAQMRLLTGPKWGVARDQRDVVGEAYLATFDRLTADGYCVRWNKANQRYDALLQPETKESSKNEKSCIDFARRSQPTIEDGMG